MRTPQGRDGFTLIELIVVIAIVTLVAALLIPAVQLARQSARGAQCKTNLRSIGTACAVHLETCGRYPTNGWGSMWMGNPDRSDGLRQPGGWIYNITPYADLSLVHEIGVGSPDKYAELARVKGYMVPLFFCPSRRKPTTYPGSEESHNAQTPPLVAKTDYAGNGGTWVAYGPGADAGCQNRYPNCTWRMTQPAANWTTSEAGDNTRANFNGIFGLMAQTKPAHIRDGNATTFLVGEKYLDPKQYRKDGDTSDNNSMFQGHDADIVRWCGSALEPKQDTAGEDTNSLRFGSPHSTGVHFVFCDGHVQLVHFEIDPVVYANLGNRKDGSLIDDSW